MKPAALAAVWLGGLVLAWQFYAAGLALTFILAALALTVALLLALLRRRLPSVPLLSPWPALLLAVFLLAAGRYSAAATVPPALLERDRQDVTVRGQVVSDPEPTATRVKFQLALTEIHRGLGQDWQPQTGQILVYAPPPAELVQSASRQPPYLRYGDLLEIPGSLHRPQPFADFDYPAYLESQGIAAVLWSHETEWRGAAAAGPWLRFRAAVYDQRRRMARSIDAALPANQAALAQAILLGLRGQLTDDIVQNFRQTGVSHLLAISGLHLGILLALTLGAFRGLLGNHTPAPLLLTLVAVWLYTLLSGASPSVMRAALMGSVYLGLLSIGRPRDTLLPALAFAAIAMTALEPRLISRISFQLSFAAMVGIALALPWQDALSRAIAGQFYAQRSIGLTAAGMLLNFLTSAIIIGAAATLTTTPLVAYHFGQLPLLGIPTTILAAPLLPFALVGGLTTALAGLLHPVLAQLAAIPAAVPLTALLLLVDWIPGWMAAATLSGPATLLCCALMLAALLLSHRLTSWRSPLGRFLAELRQERVLPALGFTADGRPRSPGRWISLGGVALILVVAVLYLATSLFGRADGRLHIHFFDIGQGDSALIVTPGGRQILVDGGPDAAGAARALAAVLPPFDRRLDAVALTHLDADHSRGLLQILQTYQADTVLAGRPDPDSPLYPQWRRALSHQDVPPRYLNAGQTLTLEDDVTLEILHPPATPLRGPLGNGNNSSLVMRLVYGDIRFLLTGDIEAAAEYYLLRRRPDLQSQVLKVAHHGSKSSTTAAFIKAVNPQWAVISAGVDNSYGHPHPSVVSRLENALGATALYRTDRHGRIHFTTDGKKLWVQTEK